jgi:hypothetical protein
MYNPFATFIDKKLIFRGRSVKSFPEEFILPEIDLF